MSNYDQWKTRCDQADADSAPDEEYGEDYLKYQLQCAFEDLCGQIGFRKARRFVIQTAVEHYEMLKRQGRKP